MNSIKTIFLVLIFGVSTAFNISSCDKIEGYKVGDLAADFSLKNIDGKQVSLSDYKNAKGFLVIFTCNTCPYAVAYEDRIIELDKKYNPIGVPVIAIMPNNIEVKPKDSFSNMQIRGIFIRKYLQRKSCKIHWRNR